MKAVVAAFNQEKALVGAFSVIVQLHRLIVYTALVKSCQVHIHQTETSNHLQWTPRIMVITGAIQSPINNANVAEMRFWFLGNQIKHRSLSEGRKYNHELFHLGRM